MGTLNIIVTQLDAQNWVASAFDRNVAEGQDPVPMGSWNLKDAHRFEVYFAARCQHGQHYDAFEIEYQCPEPDAPVIVAAVGG
jgi:hypothetical protein